jgi:hypothetical protein
MAHRSQGNPHCLPANIALLTLADCVTALLHSAGLKPILYVYILEMKIKGYKLKVKKNVQDFLFKKN